MPKKNNLGDCYVVAGKFAMGNYKDIEFNGTPHVVHAEVTGQGAISGIRYGHAWVEDDENVYDYSNDRQLVIPKQLYYYIGQVQENNPKKYRKYTFKEAVNKMLETGNYGCWDIEVEFAKGGEVAKYYRAVDTFYGQTFYFEPRGYYEAFDDDGSPIMVSGSDVFRKSTNPELSASKTIGGAILGLWSMYNHNGIDSVDKSVYIYEINKEPYKDLSHVNMYDFAYLKEVRYDKPVVGKYVGKFTYDQKFEEDAKNFYERIADNDPYSESEYDLDKWEDFEKYLLTINKRDLVNTFLKGGLIAPNGKPSNLTPEQYELVRTKAFKDWFGDWENEPDNASKVVDENGEPLVCYHGTIHDFTVFRDYDVERYSTFQTKGFYFTPQLEHAKQWGKHGDARDIDHRAIPVFLNIRHMVTLDEVTKAKVFVDMFGWHIINSLSIRFGSEITNPNQFDNPRFKDPTYRYFKDEPPRDMLGSDVKALSLKMGIGGYRFEAQYGFSKNKSDKKTYVYAVFEPNNIKLADGTNTTFDGNNPDIRFDDGGEVNSATTIFFGNRAGGVLVYCSTTNRYLILLRSIYVLEPFTWGIISGKVDDTDVNIEEAVRREAIEEAGIYLPELIPSYVFKRPNFEFHNFIAIVDEEFGPRLNWENMDYAWVSLENMPNNIHFGLKELIENEDLPKLVGDNTSFSRGGLTPNYNTQLAKQVLEQELPKIKTLECDGATRVLHYALTKAGVNHVIKQGYVKYDDDLIIPFHFWIELPDGHIIDCKSRVWLNDKVMEGMFLPKRNTYIGKEVELKMTEAMYKILTMENGGEIMQQDYSGHHTSIVAIKDKKGDILILQRGSTAPWMPNAWSLVGGGVDDGETPINAAIREAVEEISVKLTDVKFASRLYTEDMGVLYYFTATLPNGASVKLDWENQAYAWVNASNYEDYEYVPYVKEFIEKQLGLYGDGGVVFDKWSYKPLKDILGKRFREVYHTMLTPADFRIKVKSYYSVQERLKNKNYKDVPTSLTKDKNKLKSDEANIENYKYLASIVVDGRGFIRGIDKSLIPKPKSEYAKGGKVGGVSAKNYFHETHCDFKPVTPEDAKEILDAYKEWRKKRKKPQYIYSSKYGNLRVDFTSEKSNAFSNSRSLSYYFVSENEDFIIRISDHWSKSQYPKSRKLNCMLISTCFWSNTKGEKFTYRMPSQEYSSSLVAGVCHFKDFKKH